MAKEINLNQVATAKDIADLLGISHRTAERWLGELRKTNKTKRAPVTIGEVFTFKNVTVTGNTATISKW